MWSYLNTTKPQTQLKKKMKIPKNTSTNQNKNINFEKKQETNIQNKKKVRIFVIRNKILVACYLHLIFSKDKCFLHSSDSNTLANFVE
jgi:hypothetical protein